MNTMAVSGCIRPSSLGEEEAAAAAPCKVISEMWALLLNTSSSTIEKCGAWGVRRVLTLALARTADHIRRLVTLS